MKTFFSCLKFSDLLVKENNVLKYGAYTFFFILLINTVLRSCVVLNVFFSPAPASKITPKYIC